ncbi:MAG: transporter substrate-binding domain-containing protein [Verrucomicrobiota bacterium]
MSISRALRTFAFAWGMISSLFLQVDSAPAQNANPPRVLIVGTTEAPPFSMKTSDGAWEGLGIDLWRDIAAKLDLKYEIHEMDFSSLMQAVAKGNVDVAVSGITITGERARLFDFTHAIHASGLAVAVGNKSLTRRHYFQTVLEAFSTTGFLHAVLALIGVLLLAGLIVWLFERQHNPGEFGGGSAKGFGSGLWWAAVTVLGVGYGDKVPRTMGGRIVSLICMLAGIVIISSLTATIASLLTVSHFESIIHGTEDLSKFRNGTVPGTTSEAYLRARHIEPRLYPTAQDCLQALARGQIDAFVFDEPILKYLAATMNGQVQVLPVILERQDYGIALPLNSPLLRSVDIALLDETSDYAWQTIRRRYLGE